MWSRSYSSETWTTTQTCIKGFYQLVPKEDPEDTLDRQEVSSEIHAMLEKSHLHVQIFLLN